MMRKFWIILPFFLLAFGFSFAQQEATTPDGKKVLLYPDGTWKSVRVESISEIHPGSIPHIELPKANPHSQIITHKGYALSYNPTYPILPIGVLMS
jgi:hypothetical protein